jgi:glycosyltransferase involved in cell wall biosynthesis
MRKPVEVVPHYLPPEAARHHIDGAPFTVLTMADSRSSLSRKNPEGAVRAFVTAFGQSKAAKLLLKISAKDEELQAFDEQLGGLLHAPNIEIIREFMTEEALAALYGRADALISLHRSEGFGLPMLEALARGVPVVATGWSGNMDFTTPENSILVPYELVPVSDAASVYRFSHWAEPDVTTAANGLRQLADDRKFHERLASAAYRGCSDLPVHFPLTATKMAA